MIAENPAVVVHLRPITTMRLMNVSYMYIFLIDKDLFSGFFHITLHLYHWVDLLLNVKKKISTYIQDMSHIQISS